MSLQRFAPAAIAVACLAVCVSANAQSDSFRFSGFGTIGASHTDTSEAQFVTPGQPGDGATSRGVKFSPDTKIGVQANYQATSMFSGTAQLLSKENGKGVWDPSLEWAFVKAQINPEWSVRAGRIGTPFFLISDYRDVNYANLWVRPPLEVYGQVTVSNFNGLDLTYKKDIGSTTVTSTIFGGPSRAYFNTAKIKLNNQLGFNTSAEFDNGLTLRLGYAQSKLTVESNTIASLQSAYRGLATPSPLLGGASAAQTAGLSNAALNGFANAIDVQDAAASFLGIGASWDHGNWLLSGEFTKRKTDSYLSDSTGWYASVGYRVGKVTPYLYASQLKVDSANPTNPIPSNVVASAGPASASLTAKLRAASSGADYLLSSNDYGQKTVAIGARWDAFRSVAFKAQLEAIRPDGRQGLLYVKTSMPLPDLSNKTVNVLSLTADFVF